MIPFTVTPVAGQDDLTCALTLHDLASVFIWSPQRSPLVNLKQIMAIGNKVTVIVQFMTAADRDRIMGRMAEFGT